MSEAEVRSGGGTFFFQEQRQAVCQLLASLFDCEEFADVLVLVVRGGHDGCRDTLLASFFCHKAILSMRSPVFTLLVGNQALDCLDGGGVRRDTIKILHPMLPMNDQEDEKSVVEAWRKTLMFCYSGQIQMSESEALRIWKIAHTYKVTQLRDFCESFLTSLLNVHTCASMLPFLDRVSEKGSFSHICWSFFCKNYQDICCSEGFLELPYEVLAVALGPNYTLHASEDEICDSIRRWTAHASYRLRYRRSLCKLLRLPMLSPEKLVAIARFCIDPSPIKQENEAEEEKQEREREEEREREREKENEKEKGEKGEWEKERGEEEEEGGTLPDLLLEAFRYLVDKSSFKAAAGDAILDEPRFKTRVQQAEEKKMCKREIKQEGAKRKRIKASDEVIKSLIR